MVKLNYRESNWPPGKTAPYQVRLNDGRLIFAPMDDDRVIRSPVPGTEEEDPAEEAVVSDDDKTPVTVVTGFLGSGKTTLVNYILKEQHGKKICVIENEFGEVNIDDTLVKENLRSNEEIISMDNGCVCCTVRGDLVKALEQLIPRRNTFDHVVLETTGLADPAPVCFTFNINETIGNHFRVDSILTLVDSKHVELHLNEVRPEGTVNEAVQQVAYADKILLNKTDLVTPHELSEVRSVIRSINGVAEIITCQNSRVPLEKLLGLSAFSIEKMQDIIEEYEDEEESACTDPSCTMDHSHEAHGHEEHEHELKAELCKEEDCAKPETTTHSHGHSHAHSHKKKKHDISGVGSVGLVRKGEIDSAMLNKLIGGLLEKQAKDLYRSKGVLAFKGDDQRYVFQGVHEQIQFNASSVPWGEDEERVCKMVFIGKDLDREELTKGFEACFI